MKKSGAANRRARKEREAAARANDTARTAALGIRTYQRPPPPIRAHLRALEVLSEQLEEIRADPVLPTEERWRHVVATTSAMGKLQVRADLERQVAEMRERVDTAQEELLRSRADLERERRELAGGRC